MAVSESARNDLYNGLRELLGADRAETLMTYLPSYDPSVVATHSDIRPLRSEIGELRAEMGELRSEMSSGLEALGKRIDRVLLTLVAGLFVIVAAFIGLVGVVLSVI